MLIDNTFLFIFCRCFLGGDLRLNAHAGRAALQTLLVHEHNRIAQNLAELNPQWSDETIFQETRALVTAEIQHITYKEFLPILLGKQVRQTNESDHNFNAYL